MLHNHSTLENKQFKEIIKGPKLSWHSCPWWVYEKFSAQLYLQDKKKYPVIILLDNIIICIKS